MVGLSIAIVDDQGIVWAQGFGYADAAEKVPATPETVYRIGSISKLFTVMATMQLAKQGKIDVDGKKGLFFWGYKMKKQQ